MEGRLVEKTKKEQEQRNEAKDEISLSQDDSTKQSDSTFTNSFFH